MKLLGAQYSRFDYKYNFKLDDDIPLPLSSRKKLALDMALQRLFAVMKPGQSFIVERATDWKDIRLWTKAHGFECRGAREIHPQTGKKCWRLWLMAEGAAPPASPAPPVPPPPVAASNGHKPPPPKAKKPAKEEEDCSETEPWLSDTEKKLREKYEAGLLTDNIYDLRKQRLNALKVNNPGLVQSLEERLQKENYASRPL
jgi:hypothetical protein